MVHTTLYDGDGGLTEAVRVLRRGHLVALPTETVYGLAALAESQPAVRSIFRAKGRPSDNPLIVHFGSTDSALSYCPRLSPVEEALIVGLMPGPFTLVVEKNPALAPEVTAGLGTMAVRVPAHPLALNIISRLPGPVAAPSANRSGRPSPTTSAMVLADLGGRISGVVEGGSCPVGLESTVARVVDHRVHILRPGWIGPQDIASVLSARSLELEVTESPHHQIHSPGTRHRHYAPDLSLSTYDPRQQPLVGHGDALIYCRELSPLWSPDPSISPVVSFETTAHYAAGFYKSMVQFESLSLGTVHLPLPRGSGLAEALADRINRAAAG